MQAKSLCRLCIRTTSLIFLTSIIIAKASADATIFVETSLGDFIDKITILRIKYERIHDKTKRANVEKELGYLLRDYDTFVSHNKVLVELTQKLMEVNKNLWDLEDAIRCAECEKNFGSEFIDIFKAILENNDERAYIKRTINTISGSSIVEEKSYRHIKILETDSKNRNITDQPGMPASISIAVSLGDLVDRVTILIIKQERITDESKKAHIVYELTLLNATLDKYVARNDEFNALKRDLLEANKQMWDIQDAVRAKKSMSAFDEEFIQLARSNYRVNDYRCAVKRLINQKFDSALIEEKVYTLY